MKEQQFLHFNRCWCQSRFMTSSVNFDVNLQNQHFCHLRLDYSRTQLLFSFFSTKRADICWTMLASQPRDRRYFGLYMCTLCTSNVTYNGHVNAHPCSVLHKVLVRMKQEIHVCRAKAGFRTMFALKPRLLCLVILHSIVSERTMFSAKAFFSPLSRVHIMFGNVLLHYYNARHKPNISMDCVESTQLSLPPRFRSQSALSEITSQTSSLR